MREKIFFHQYIDKDIKTVCSLIKLNVDLPEPGPLLPRPRCDEPSTLRPNMSEFPLVEP